MEAGSVECARVGGLTFSQRRSGVCSRLDTVAASFAHVETRPTPAGPSMEALIAAARARTFQACVEEQAEPKTTPAMRAVAAGRDMREAFSHHHHDEEADFARRCAGAGYAEETLAREGN